MPLDLKRIDERIKKLQEIRKIAANGEMVSLISEFLTSGEGVAGDGEATPQAASAEPLTACPGPDEVSEFVKGVLEGPDAVRPVTLVPGRIARKI